MKKIFFILLIAYGLSNSIAQPVKFNRMHRYNITNLSPKFNQVVQKNNQYICFGHFDPLILAYPVLISPIAAKFNSSGDIINWIPFIDTNYNYLLSTFNTDINTKDNGYIISGQACTNNLNPPNTYKGFLMKLDSNLNMQWRRYYCDSNPNSLWTYKDYTFLTLNTTPDNGYIAAGYRYRNSGVATALAVKLDSLGNEQWTKTHLENKIFSMYSSVIPLSSGGYVFGGNLDTTNNNLYAGDGIIIKTDSLGNIIWQKTIGGVKSDGYLLLQNHPDGSIMVFQLKSDSAVISQGNYNGYFKIQFYKLSAITGDIIWSMSYGNYKYNEGTYAFRVFADGSALVSGFYGFSFNVPWLLHLNVEGNVDWYKEYNIVSLSGQNYFKGAIYDLQQTTDSGFVICGLIDNTDTANYGFCWLMKTDKNGCWKANCDSANYIQPNVKLESSLEVFPNPASSEVTANYFTDIDQGIIEIYNTLGIKQMEVKLPKGQNNYKFSIAHLAKGYYKVILKEKGTLRGQQGLIVE